MIRLTIGLLLAGFIPLLWAQEPAGSERPLEQEQEKPNLLYKSYDESGRATYSDQPPADQEGAKVIDPESLDVNVMQKRPELEAYRQELLEASEQRDQEREQRKEEIQAAKSAVEAAKEALEKGKEPKQEDWQYTKEKRRFLKPQYYERVEKLEKELKAAQKALRAVD
ncbi:hypothetical protein GP5015_774 [gamma proteobacterium HTCC5015]|nr:hypothetical protein GP5015_774 [gamma proteobacterium HTCC5015]